MKKAFLFICVIFIVCSSIKAQSLIESSNPSVNIPTISTNTEEVSFSKVNWGLVIMIALGL